MNSTTITACWTSIPKAQWGAPSVTQYRETRQVGKGTYGEVFLGENCINKQIVALKKVSVMHTDLKHRHRGLPLNALREIRLLKSSKCVHPNIVQLLQVAVQSSNNNSDGPYCYLVFEYVEHDLAGILDSEQVLSVSAVKCLARQLLLALEFLHDRSICHRDLKCSNLLVTANHVLKLGDFGLARELKENSARKLSLNVVTLWYRAPEILLGDVHYTTIVDMWSAGCILVELLKRTPLFQGKDDADQIVKIFSMCGVPTERECARLATLPGFKRAAERAQASNAGGGEHLSEYLERKHLDLDAAGLAKRLLEMDPARRYTAKQALQSQFVTMHCPLPQDLPPISATASLHEWETKRKRRGEQSGNEQAEPAPQPQPQPTVEEPRAQRSSSFSQHLPPASSSRARRRSRNRRSRSPAPRATNARRR